MYASELYIVEVIFLIFSIYFFSYYFIYTHIFIKQQNKTQQKINHNKKKINCINDFGQNCCLNQCSGIEILKAA